MPENQEKIRDFPQGNDLWLVKWIDEFRLPHLRTRSASVSVILQKLPFSDRSQLNALTPDAVERILGGKYKEDETLIKHPFPRVMAGTLPKIQVGAVFQNQQWVGDLPMQVKTIEFASEELSGEEVTLGQKMAPPDGWNPELPYRILNLFEYAGIARMSQSRCLTMHIADTLYIIPRTAIFKTFYAPHTEMAKAFCSGPWKDSHREVICLSDLSSGLKTKADSKTGQWNIILQTLVPKAFAELLALLYFDPYARTCAESIYVKSLQDRNGKLDMPWYTAAQIPFRECEQKLRLRVSGFYLRKWRSKDIKNTVRKFLVSEIIGSSWPNYIPQIGWERINSGEKGGIEVKVSEPAPYSIPSNPILGGPGTVIDGQEDADADTPPTHMRNSEFIWLNAPPKIKLKKTSSKKYEETRPPKEGGYNGNVSTGEHTRQKGALAKGEAEISIRRPVKRFEHILKAFDQLIAQQVITSKYIIQPRHPGQHIKRSGYPCWSFIDEKSLNEGLRPKRSWRLIEYSRKNPAECLYRSALVVALVIGGKTLYWIEIECRKKDGGFLSPILWGVTGDCRDNISTVLEDIAIAKGINLGSKLEKAAEKCGIVIDCYRHKYLASDSPDLDTKSIKRFLLRHSPRPKKSETKVGIPDNA